MDAAGPDLLDALWRFRRSVILITLLVFALSTGAGLLLGGQAHAEATLALTQPGNSVLGQGIQGDAAFSRYTQQRALFARSDGVLTVAAADLPGSTLTELRRVSVSPSATSTSIVVAADASTGRRAVAIVDSVIAAYRTETTKQVAYRTDKALVAIRGSIAKLQADARTSSPVPPSVTQAISDLQKQADDYTTSQALVGDGVDFVQAATRESSGGRRLPLREMALGLLLGLALAAVVAWVRADRDRRLIRPRQAESVLEVPLLGELPQMRSPLLNPGSRAAVVRRCREVVAPVVAAGFRGALLVTSAERRSGCSTATLGVAAAAAAEGLRVLVVDADPRTKGLTSLLGLSSESAGLVEGVVGDPDALAASYRRVEVVPGLVVTALAAGNPQGDEWDVTSAGLERLLGTLRLHFDLIVLDGPAPEQEYVSSALTVLVEGVVVVVRRDARVAQLTELRQQLALHGSAVLGYVYTFAHARRAA